MVKELLRSPIFLLASPSVCACLTFSITFGDIERLEAISSICACFSHLATPSVKKLALLCAFLSVLGSRALG
jgi:hypothetical protein